MGSQEMTQKEVKKVQKGKAPPAPAAAEAAAPEPNPMEELKKAGRSLMMLPLMWGMNKVDWTTDFAKTALPVTATVVITTIVLMLQLALARVAAAKDNTRLTNPGSAPNMRELKAEDG